MCENKRLIDANALLEELDKFANPMPNRSGYEFLHGIATVITEIEDATTVDAVEVVHGRWIYHECVSSFDGLISGYSCSECNSFVDEEIFDMDEFHKDFCGHCGAKMDGDGNGYDD